MLELDWHGLEQIETPVAIHQYEPRSTYLGHWEYHWKCSCGADGNASTEVALMYGKWLAHALRGYRKRDFIRVNNTVIYKPRQ